MSAKPSSVSPQHNDDNRVGLSHRGDRGVGGPCGVAEEPADVVMPEVMPVDGGADAQGSGDGGAPPESAALEAEVEEEVDRAAPLPAYQPTKSDYDEHCVTHTPYRPWCNHCVNGRGQEFPNVRRKDCDPNRIPLVAFDYAGITDKGETLGLEVPFDPSDESVMRVFVVGLRTSDDKRVAIFAHVVPSKGVVEEKFAVDCLVSDIVWSGYTRVMLKSDNEVAILKLLVEALRELRINGLEQVVSENSPEYDPQANGAAEVAVKAWKGMFRTQRSSLETQIGMIIPVRHPLMTWLTKWSAEVLTWTLRGQDGITPYQRIRGKLVNTRFVALGRRSGTHFAVTGLFRTIGDGEFAFFLVLTDAQDNTWFRPITGQA